MRTLRFKSTDISCEGCAAAIEAALKPMRGVVSSSVDIPSQTITVEVDAGTLPEVISTAVGDAGFDAVQLSN